MLLNSQRKSKFSSAFAIRFSPISKQFSFDQTPIEYLNLRDLNFSCKRKEVSYYNNSLSYTHCTYSITYDNEVNCAKKREKEGEQMGHSTTTWTQFYPILTPSPSSGQLRAFYMIPGHVTKSGLSTDILPPPSLFLST